MAEETQAAKKPKKIKTTPAPKPKKKVEGPRGTGCLPLDDNKVYKLRLSQRAMLKAKGVSIDTVPKEMKGKDLNAAMIRIKSNYVMMGIEK